MSIEHQNFTHKQILRISGFIMLFIPYLLLGLNNFKVPEDLSSLYYSDFGYLYSGAHLVLGVLFFLYLGYDNRDRLMFTLLGVTSIGVGIIPPRDPGTTRTVLNFIHGINEVLFFFIIIYIFQFLFTLSYNPSKYKLVKNRIYTINSITIFISLVFLIFLEILDFGISNTTFWFTIIMYNAAGLGFLIKGGMINFLKDVIVEVDDKTTRELKITSDTTIIQNASTHPSSIGKIPVKSLFRGFVLIIGTIADIIAIFIFFTTYVL